MSVFCKHKWEVLSETTTKSKFEVVAERVAGGKQTLPRQLVCAKRKLVQVFVCSKCGKFKRFVENI